MNRLRVLLVVVLTLGTWRVLMACGSSGNNNAQGNNDGGSDGPASSSSSGAGSGSGSGSGGDGGASSSSSSGGGASPCPVYQSLCNGKCIPTAVDPNNCGGCGIVCTGNQVCASNACVSGPCPPTTTACNHSCVDTGSDNANCGMCGHACPSGQGCVAGSCVTAVPLGPPPAKCTGGGPPINVGDGGAATCTPNLGQTTFTWALCSCTDVNVQDVLLTDAYDSTKGPYPNSKTPGGGVGLDRTFTSMSSTTVGGALWASSSNGLTSDGTTSVGEELHSGGAVNVQALTVGYDGFVNGNVNGGTFDKNLTVPNGATVGATVKGQVIHVPPPVSVPPPCDCTPSNIIPVAAIVQKFASPNNDNAAIGLNPAVLNGPGAPTRLDLPCGYYYLDSIQNSVEVTIVAHGNTGLFIGGSITPQAALTITLDPTAQLDLFVAGTISSSDTLVIGAVNYPALSRTYVGSSASLSFMSGTTLGSNLYAANAPLDWSAGTDIFGSVFCGNFSGSANVGIHYDSEILQIGTQSCGPPPSMCTACGNCGNQACVNGTCGSCSSSAQCCAPLLCQNGTCVQAVQ
jgi:hypothetical protein